MDKDDDNEQQQRDGESQQKGPIKKTNITRCFDKESIKFLSIKHQVNWVKQKIKIITRLNKSRYTRTPSEPKFQVEWKPTRQNKNTVTILPLNSNKAASIQLQSKYQFSTGFKASLSINSFREGSLKFDYKNSFRDVSFKSDLEFERKKELVSKWGLEIRKKFVHQIWSNYLSAHHSQLYFKLRGWKPEVKLITMSQTPDEYKFFTETKVSQGKSVDGKLSLQVELPKGRHIFFTEIKKPIMSGKPIPFACELKYLFSPFKNLKTGISINEKRNYELVFQQYKVPFLRYSDFYASVGNRNAVFNLRHNYGKLKLDFLVQAKTTEWTMPLIGMKLSYNVDYQKPEYKKTSLKQLEQESNSKTKPTTNANKLN